MGLYCIVLYCIVLYCIVLYCIVLYCIVLEGLEEDEEITADTHKHTHTHTHNSDSLSQPVPSGYGLRENIAILLVEVTECLRKYFYQCFRMDVLKGVPKLSKFYISPK